MVQVRVCTIYERPIIAIDEVHTDIIRDREASERREHAEHRCEPREKHHN